MEFDEMMATSAGKKRKEKIAEAEKQGEVKMAALHD